MGGVRGRGDLVNIISAVALVAILPAHGLQGGGGREGGREGREGGREGREGGREGVREGGEGVRELVTRVLYILVPLQQVRL